MKKSYKKRSRKRSTKKRARRRTKKAGEYSKIAKDLLRSKTERKIGLAKHSRPLREYFQKRDLDDPDADLADKLAVHLKRKKGQIEGMAAKRKAAQEKYRKQKRRKIEPHPKAKKMTSSFTLGGGKRKRKTRRRRRRRR